MGISTEQVPGMAEAIEARRLWRNLSPTEFAKASGVTIQGLGPVRAGQRKRYMHKLKIGVARALWWPDDAIDRLLAGADPSTFDTVQPPSDTIDLAAKLEEVDAQLAELRAEVNELRQQRSAATTPPRPPARPAES